MTYVTQRNTAPAYGLAELCQHQVTKEVEKRKKCKDKDSVLGEEPDGNRSAQREESEGDWPQERSKTRICVKCNSKQLCVGKIGFFLGVERNVRSKVGPAGRTSKDLWMCVPVRSW